MALVGMVENTGCMFVACGLPSILKFSQVFVIWECTDLLCPEQGMAPGTVHRNAVCTIARETFGAGCEQKQKKHFCSHSKDAVWMEMICQF